VTTVEQTLFNEIVRLRRFCFGPDNAFSDEMLALLTEEEVSRLQEPENQDTAGLTLD
jgi:hypothetical protein